VNVLKGLFANIKFKSQRGIVRAGVINYSLSDLKRRLFMINFN
jgi:hypothetical protein